jgi:hypothetical protein
MVSGSILIEMTFLSFLTYGFLTDPEKSYSLRISIPPVSFSLDYGSLPRGDDPDFLIALSLAVTEKKQAQPPAHPQKKESVFLV